MPHAFEFCMRYKFIQLLPNVRSRQIHPAHDAGDERILIRETQQPASFFETVAGLDQNCFFNAASFQYRLKCRRQIILTKNLDFRSHPWIIEASNLPEMLVTIDYVFHLSFQFPLPLGEGQGEGAKHRKRKKKCDVFSLAKPSPQPSPRGRGKPKCQITNSIFKIAPGYKLPRAVSSPASLRYPVLPLYRIRAQML